MKNKLENRYRLIQPTQNWNFGKTLDLKILNHLNSIGRSHHYGSSVRVT